MLPLLTYIVLSCTNLFYVVLRCLTLRFVAKMLSYSVSQFHALSCIALQCPLQLQNSQIDLCAPTLVLHCAPAQAHDTLKISDEAFGAPRYQMNSDNSAPSI